MPHAVPLLPSIACAAVQPAWSKSAVADRSFSAFGFAPLVTVAVNSLRCRLPLSHRPGPRNGSDSSVSSSNRTAVTRPFTRAVSVYVSFSGRVPSARIESSPRIASFDPSADAILMKSGTVHTTAALAFFASHAATAFFNSGVSSFTAGSFFAMSASRDCNPFRFLLAPASGSNGTSPRPTPANTACSR